MQWQRCCSAPRATKLTPVDRQPSPAWRFERWLHHKPLPAPLPPLPPPPLKRPVKDAWTKDNSRYSAQLLHYTCMPKFTISKTDNLFTCVNIWVNQTPKSECTWVQERLNYLIIVTHIVYLINQWQAIPQHMTPLLLDLGPPTPFFFFSPFFSTREMGEIEHRPCYQRGSLCQDTAGNRTTRRPEHRQETQTAVVWSCLPFIRSLQNHLARHSERGKKTRQTENEVGRQLNITEWTGLEFGKSQSAVENREKLRKLVAKSSVVPQ